MAKVTLDPTVHQVWAIYGFIERARKNLKLTQAQLGDMVGMTQQQYSYKLTNYAFTVEDLLRIAKVLKPDDNTLLRLMR